MSPQAAMALCTVAGLTVGFLVGASLFLAPECQRHCCFIYRKTKPKPPST